MLNNGTIYIKAIVNFKKRFKEHLATKKTGHTLTLLCPGGGKNLCADENWRFFKKKSGDHILKARGLIFYNLTIYI